MAKNCTKCGFENADSAVICAECGEELAAVVAAPKKVKKPFKKQKQNTAIRNILLLVMIASIVLCLFASIQHICGEQILYKVETISGQDAPTTNKSITFTNTWTLLSNLFKNIKSFDFAQSNTVFTVFRLLAQGSNVTFYLLLIALLGFTTFMIFKKHPKAGLLCTASGIAGLLVIICGFLIGYFFIVLENGPYYLRALPQLAVLPLIPLFAEMPLLGMMLASKDRKNKEDK